jgi:UDP-N-acetylglucosamine--dolichyl-phosphate N-acetylglucosaminephosphotransferase
MVDYLLLTCFAASFLTTLVLTPMWIRAALKANLKGKDMNKYGHPEVAEFGGVTVVAGFMAGVLAYIGLSTFYFHQDAHLIHILAALSTILSISIVGLLDDLLGWKAGFLKKWEKPLLTLPAALPMMVVNAGQSSMNLPLLGSVDFGILYPLLIVPIGIVGAANGFNMLAGYNGLEAGMGAIILTAMGYIAWRSGSSWVTMLAFCAVFALLAFLVYNWYPAKVFPGDTLTYSVGALIACVAILGNMEKIALILFIPYFLDFLLPLRARFQTEAFAKVNPDGSLEMPYGKDYRGIYDTTHLALYILKKLERRVYERDVVAMILLSEALLGILSILWVA